MVQVQAVSAHRGKHVNPLAVTAGKTRTGLPQDSLKTASAVHVQRVWCMGKLSISDRAEDANGALYPPGGD